MSRRSKLEDAPEDVEFEVTLKQALKAREKNKSSCVGVGDARKWGCALEISFLDKYLEFRSVRVDGTVARAKWRDESRDDWRWILEADGKRIANLNDLNMKELLNQQWPIKVRFISAIKEIRGEDDTSRMKRYTRSLAWGRSDEGKLVKLESAIKRAKEIEKGSPVRIHSTPSGKWRDGRVLTSFYEREDDEDC
jgi:hypothetical protein